MKTIIKVVVYDCKSKNLEDYIGLSVLDNFSKTLLGDHKGLGSGKTIGIVTAAQKHKDIGGKEGVELTISTIRKTAVKTERLCDGKPGAFSLSFDE